MESKMEQRILRILDHAYYHTPYFNHIINNIIDTDLDFSPELFFQLPVFHKSTIKDMGWPNFISDQYLDHKYRPLPGKGVRLERTSGTTGSPMQILWDNNDYFSSIKNHWSYRDRYFSITPCSRFCTSSKTIPGGGLYYIRKNRLTFSIKSLTIENIRKILIAIYDFQPDWLYLQNSILYILVYAAEKLGIGFPDTIRYIEYIGEPVCKYYRTKIETAIGAPSSDMYGCVETNGISYECAYGNHHLMTDNVYVEIVDRNGVVQSDGNVGYVCVTGLHNTGMPMLRYRLNDLASISHDHCLCGSSSPMIHIKAARMPEFLLLNDPAIFAPAELYCPSNAGIELFDIRRDDICFNLKINTLDHYDVLLYQNVSTDIKVDAILRDILTAYGLPEIRFTISAVEKPDNSKLAGILRVR